MPGSIHSMYPPLARHQDRSRTLGQTSDDALFARTNPPGVFSPTPRDHDHRRLSSRPVPTIRRPRAETEGPTDHTVVWGIGHLFWSRRRFPIRMPGWSQRFCRLERSVIDEAPLAETEGPTTRAFISFGWQRERVTHYWGASTGLLAGFSAFGPILDRTDVTAAVPMCRPNPRRETASPSALMIAPHGPSAQ